MDRPNFAYLLKPHDRGWRWSILDASGTTMATGLEAAKSNALAAIEISLRALSGMLARESARSAVRDHGSDGAARRSRAARKWK